jgi:hypothetical protein
VLMICGVKSEAKTYQFHARPPLAKHVIYP